MVTWWAMVSDYADAVRFFEHPQVNREFIAQDQTNYLSKLRTHSERIPGAVEFVNFTGDRAIVVYDLQVSSIDLRGKPSEVMAKDSTRVSERTEWVENNISHTRRQAKVTFPAMFGLLKKNKPIVQSHWYVPLLDFRSDPEAFYRSIEEELAKRQVPESIVERISFRDGNRLSASRSYLRLRRERAVLDICSAPFGTSWYFSCRCASIPRPLYWWEVWLAMLGVAGFFGIYWHLFGLITGSIVFGSSAVFLLLVLFSARNWVSLDEFVSAMPVIGGLYEKYFRPETYHRQDQRLIYGDLVVTIVRDKVKEYCAAGGVQEPDFRNVSNVEQIISAKEMAKFTGSEKDAT